MDENKLRSKIYLFAIAIVLALTVYFVDYLIFGDARETIEGIMLAIAYVPVGVIYQSFVIDRIIEKSENLKLRKKITMIKGFFFSEVGRELISLISEGDKDIDTISESTAMNRSFTDIDFKKIEKILLDYDCHMEVEKVDLGKVEKKLNLKDEFIINLIISPFFGGSEEFTTMLSVVINLREQLREGDNYDNYNELELDNIKRSLCTAYKYLLVEWIRYLNQVREFSPFIYLKAINNYPMIKKISDINE